MGSTSGGEKVKTDPLVKKQQQIGAAEWQRYKTSFAPVEQQYLQQTTEIGSGRERDYLAGMAENQRQQQLGPLPNTGRLGQLIKPTEAAATSRLPEAAILQAKNRKAKGLETAISLGRDIGTGALGRMGRQAQLNTSKNIAEAEAAGIKQAGFNDAVGTIAGIGINQYLKKPPAGELDTLTINGYDYDTGLRR